MTNPTDAFNNDSNTSADHSGKDPVGPRVIESHDLFQGSSVIQIRHVDEIYTLRQTRLGKLILNK